MKFSANRTELLPIVRRLCQTVGRRFTTKEAACILMEADGSANAVIFTVHNAECTLQIRHQCMVEESGSALLFAGVLLEALQRFSDEATHFQTDDRTFCLRNAKSVYEFALLDVRKYPRPEPAAPDMLIDCDGLPALAARVLFSAAHEETTRPELRCVHLTVKDGQCSAASCDGYRLTLAGGSDAQAEPFGVLLTDTAAGTLDSVFRGVRHVKAGRDGGKVLFLGPGMVFTTQACAYEYVDLNRFTGHFTAAYEIGMDSGLLLTELKRLGAGGASGMRVLLQTPDKNSLRLSCMGGADGLTGSVEASAQVRAALPKDGFCYSYPYLRQAAAFAGGQPVTLRFDRTGALMLLAGQELHLLLPMRAPKPASAKTKKTGKNAA